MTPQTSFMVVVPLSESRVQAVRQLLATMNSSPGIADPANSLLPFGDFDNLHFARFVVLDDPTTEDISLYGIARPKPPVYLAFVGEMDGSYGAFMKELVARAGPGLQRIFSHCEGFSAEGDLLEWLRSHEFRPAAFYCNWAGRTVVQCREEECLRQRLREYIGNNTALRTLPAASVHSELRSFLWRERNGGALHLTPPAQTPLLWSIRHLLDVLLLLLIVVAGTLSLVVTWPVLWYLWRKLRRLEEEDTELDIRPSTSWAQGLSSIEDFGPTNQFSVIGSVKPGKFRARLIVAVFFLIDLTARVYYTRGRLARVHTIHFARWVFLDDNTRVFFASNYDGSLESYMDDFINKVAFGLNAAFSNGVGYPRTESLLLKGAKNEQLFKYNLRRHQLPTEVWYDGLPGLTNFDLERNSRIRQGLEKLTLSNKDAAEWVAML